MIDIIRTIPMRRRGKHWKKSIEVYGNIEIKR